MVFFAILSAIFSTMGTMHSKMSFSLTKNPHFSACLTGRQAINKNIRQLQSLKFAFWSLKGKSGHSDLIIIISIRMLKYLSTFANADIFIAFQCYLTLFHL